MVARRVRLFVFDTAKVLVGFVATSVMVVGATAGTTTYDYDVHGRLKDVFSPNGTDQTSVVYTYDAAGNRVLVKTSTPPHAPATLAATAISYDTIRLSWTASLDAGGGAVSYYRVYRGGVLVASPNGVTFDDYPLTDCTTYSYRVSAVDSSGNESAQSPVATATTPDHTPPSVPSGLQGTPTSGTTVSLSWSPSQDNTGGSGLAGYEIFRNQGANPIGTSTVASFTDQGLTPATPYQYQVRSYDAAGNRSALSNLISVTTIDTVPPLAPGNPTFSSITLNSATATWTTASDNVGVTGYRYSLDNGVSWTPLGNVTTTNLTGLASATSYTMYVQAGDAAGNWGPSGSGSFTTNHNFITIATGARPVSAVPAYAGTYGCQYYVDYYYYIEYDLCYVQNGGSVFYQYYSPPSSPWTDTGYIWNGSSLVVDAAYFGTY